MNIISSRIKLLRKKENLTQREFSKRLLVSQSYLSGVENGSESPSEKFLKLIALEFGVNEKWLFNGEGDMYDDSYENSREYLSKISNKALIEIMTLLNTDSNTNYASIAYSLSFFSDIFKSGKTSDDYNVDFLEEVSILMADIARLFYYATSDYDLKEHYLKVTEDIKQCIKCIKPLK